MAEQSVYICFGWDDYEGGKNYIVFGTEEKAKEWVEKSEELTAKYWALNDGERNEIEKQLESICSEENDNFKYEKKKVVY